MPEDSSEITIILVSLYSKSIIEKPINLIDPNITIGLLIFLIFFFLNVLNSISEKILFGSPKDINNGLFFTNEYILFYFVIIN